MLAALALTSSRAAFVPAYSSAVQLNVDLLRPPASERLGRPAMMWSLEDPASSLVALVQDVGLDGVLDWEAIDSVVIASNAREDLGGVVGGSYGLVAMAGLLSGAATAHVIASQRSKQEELVPFGDFKKQEEVGLRPAFEWLAGAALPSLEELQDACVQIANSDGRYLFLCATPEAGTCDEDEIFSDYYGQPMYVCQL